MKAAPWIVLLLAGSAAAVCVRLGFWQLSRLDQKRTENAARAVRFERPPIPFAAPYLPESLRGRRVVAHGRYDDRRHILLYGRERHGEPGVRVLTPLLVAGDSLAVLVDRGWLPAGDSQTARPQDHPEPGARDVLGIADTFPAVASSAVRVIEDDSLLLLSMKRPDAKAVAARFPYALTPVWLTALPERESGRASPIRDAPVPAGEGTHLAYAIQWFVIALVFASMGIALARRGVR